MKSIWKYPLKRTDGQQVLSLPKDATVLCVGDQHGVPTLWAEVETEAAHEPRYFQVHGTGHPVAGGGHYLGTAVGAPFVWHVYEHTEHRN